MKSLHKPSRTANNPAPEPPPAMPEGPFDPKNPDHARWWAHAMREAAEDLYAAAREGTRRLKHRVLARPEIRRQARAAKRTLKALIDRAEGSLVG